jgi:hypothetical protein
MIERAGALGLFIFVKLVGAGVPKFQAIIVEINSAILSRGIAGMRSGKLKAKLRS